MSEEEKEAVKILEDEDNIIVKIGYNDYGVAHIRKVYDDGEKERILNLIEMQDMLIEVMARQLTECAVWDFDKDKVVYFKNKDMVIEYYTKKIDYYTKKVEGENE